MHKAGIPASDVLRVKQVIMLDEHNLFINRYHLLFKENIFSLCPRNGILLRLSMSQIIASKNIFFVILLNNSTRITFNSQFYISSHRSSGMAVGTIIGIHFDR